MTNDFSSDEHRKAVMAKLRKDGLIKEEKSYESYPWSVIFDPHFFEIRTKVLEKEIDELKVQINHRILEREIEEYEEKQKSKLEKEIKQILSLNEPKEYKKIESLSLKINDIVRKSVQLGIDKNMILQLREKHQHLVSIMREHK